MEKLVVLEIGSDDKIIFNLGKENYNEEKLEKIKKFIEDGNTIPDYEIRTLKEVMDIYSFIKNEKDLDEVISSFFRDEREDFLYNVLYEIINF